MTDRSAIEWTDATWNPLRGCSRVSAGCQRCYAERMARRFAHKGQPYEGLIHPVTQGWNGTVRLVPEVLTQPLRWKRPRRIFVNSMSDLFHESVPDAWIDQIFAIMALSPQHTFQILTKRADRMHRYMEDRREEGWTEGYIRLLVERPARAFPREFKRLPLNNGVHMPWPLPNVWLGVSVENQAAADERIPLLLQTTAAVRWVSCEPLLGPVTLNPWLLAEHGRRSIGANAGLHWIVAGGESGQHARPMHPDWARVLRDQCTAAHVPFFFKQWGAWWQYVNEDHYTHCGPERQPHAWVDRDTADHGLCWLVDDDGSWSSYTGEPPMHEDGQVLPRVAIMGHYGKKAAGRLLDDVLHDDYPDPVTGRSRHGVTHDSFPNQAMGRVSP